MSPLRDYECSLCVAPFTYIERTPQDIPKECPVCSGTDLKRLFSAFGGYKVRGNNSASTTPKDAGSKRHK